MSATNPRELKTDDALRDRRLNCWLGSQVFQDWVPEGDFQLTSRRTPSERAERFSHHRPLHPLSFVLDVADEFFFPRETRHHYMRLKYQWDTETYMCDRRTACIDLVCLRAVAWMNVKLRHVEPKNELLASILRSVAQRLLLERGKKDHHSQAFFDTLHEFVDLLEQFRLPRFPIDWTDCGGRRCACCSSQ